MYSQVFHVCRTVRCLEWKGHDFKTFRAGIRPKSCRLKAENDAQTTADQPQNNFQKVKKNDFFDQKNRQITGNNFGKSVDFSCILDLSAPIVFI